MRYFLLLSGLLLAACTPSEQEKQEPVSTLTAQVTFRVKAEAVEEGEAVFLTGSLPQLGNWQPGKVKCSKTEKGFWEKTLEIEKDTEIAFKFTKGSWENEAISPEGHPFANSRLLVKNDTVFQIEIANWKEEGDKKVYGQITGEVKYHKDLKAEGLQKRDLIVWLPPNYDQNTQKRYPVLYMHDGQNIIDPATASFGHDWQLDEIADSLIRNQAIEPMIIVGIYNTTDRSAEYLPGDTARMYMNFVVKQVKPLVDQTYRTLPDREHTITGGSSAGGILAFMLVWEHTAVFSKAICMSPAFKIQHIDYVKNVEAYSGPKKDIHMYVDNGGVGLEAKLQPGIDDMLKALEVKGYTQEEVTWVWDNKAEHNEQAWARRAHKPLKLFFGKTTL